MFNELTSELSLYILVIIAMAYYPFLLQMLPFLLLILIIFSYYALYAVCSMESIKSQDTLLLQIQSYLEILTSFVNKLGLPFSDTSCYSLPSLIIILFFVMLFIMISIIILIAHHYASIKLKAIRYLEIKIPYINYIVSVYPYFKPLVQASVIYFICLKIMQFIFVSSFFLDSKYFSLESLQRASAISAMYIAWIIFCTLSNRNQDHKKHENSQNYSR